jgi:hypothetical protein
MSGNIYWQPWKGKELATSTPSKLVNVLGISEGREHSFTGANVNFLHGVVRGDSNLAEPIGDLIEAIRKHGTVRVWVEY